MSAESCELESFGWRAAQGASLTPELAAAGRPARVASVHRGAIDVIGPGLAARVLPHRGDRSIEADAATVGDFVVVDHALTRAIARLERTSLFRRRAAGGGRVQAIAANVDTLFIVTSCNRDFNPARLERYVSLALAGGAAPVIVLTKVDEAGDPAPFEAAARRLGGVGAVVLLDARDPACAQVLSPWCRPGETVALVGSSGVGKSTLINTLSGAARQATAEVRADDQRGRHTTSARTLHALSSGAWLIDTPGMRELRLAEAEQGVEELFAGIAALSAGCRFADCRHSGEPGCAVAKAIDAGEIEPGEIARYRKLAAEAALSAEEIGTRRNRERAFTRKVRAATGAKRGRRGGGEDGSA